MDRMGWSSQRPQRRAFQRNDEAIELWRKEVLPEIKKVRDLNAALGLEDEAGFTMVTPLKRTWSRRGQTPVRRTSIDHHDRLNLLGVRLVSPKGKKIRLSIKSYWHSLTGEEVIAFLKQILRLVRGFIVLVWDRHPIHKRKAVQDFIQSHQRLIVFEFPVAAPELNPAEFIWTQMVEYVAGTAPHDKYELQANVFAGISRTRISQSGLFSCLRGSKLDWLN
jgi:transposase